MPRKPKRALAAFVWGIFLAPTAAAAFQNPGPDVIASLRAAGRITWAVPVASPTPHVFTVRADSTCGLGSDSRALSLSATLPETACSPRRTWSRSSGV